MHSPSLLGSKGHKSGRDVLLSVASLVTEGRIPEEIGPTSKGFREGPHCLPCKEEGHSCDAADSLCANYEFFREEILRAWVQNLALSLEFILTCGCPEGEYSVGPEVEDNCILLETWNFSIIGKRNSELPTFQLAQLIGAIKSQLYFSQITAWLTTANENTKKRLTSKHLRYRIIQPGDSSKSTKFMMNPVEHNFPTVTVNSDTVLKVSFCSLPRMSHFPLVECPTCKQGTFVVDIDEIDIRDKSKKFIGSERIPYTSNGKHYCDDNEQSENGRQSETLAKFKRLRQNLREEQASTSTINHLNSMRWTSLKEERKLGTCTNVRQTKKADEFVDQSREDLILAAMDRVVLRNHEKLRTPKLEPMDVREMQVVSTEVKIRKKCNINKSLKENDTLNRHLNRTFSKKQLVGCVCDNYECDKCKSDKNSLVTLNRVDSGYSDSIPILNKYNSSNHAKKAERLNFVDHKEIDKGSVPSIDDQTKFKKILNSSASMLFHKTGLPLMSSPAPVRKGKTCFDFDPSINSATDIKRAFFSSSLSTDEESESDGSQMSPCSPETYLAQNEEERETKASAPRHPRRRKGQATNLLGSFEESVLNGRLEPVSTVQGFTAELGASGSFTPKQLKLPVTVFFYTVGDHQRMSSPYLCHIKLEKKGYCVPKVGTFQMTLKNPNGSVVKMFVILYDLSDMPPNSKTFMRQRILFLPTECKDESVQRTSKWLKYLIHLRFASSKSGKLYLHGDIRIIVLNKADLDTANAHDIDTKYEMRTITLMPINPRYSLRK